MRIVQIIDSLHAGGAERMAVNYANALADTIEFSGLVVTRKEGSLAEQVQENVSYLFLNKKRRIDGKALFALRRYITQNKVQYIHAHSTSFFIAFLLKLTLPTVTLIWHDHYGDSEFLAKRPAVSLKIIMPFFKGIVAVNHKLKNWATSYLKHKNVIYLANFPSLDKEITETTVLEGTHGKRIVCLANLRAQKNHFLLLNVAWRIKNAYPEWTFHLVGKDFEDQYSVEVKQKIKALHLEKNVFLYGSKKDISNILKQSEIAILTSNSEGLPVAILEYGIHKKPIVATNVGDISGVIVNQKNGLLVPPGDEESFYFALLKIMSDANLKINFEEEIYKTIQEQFSKESVIENYLNWVRNEC